jgi:ABC-type transport system involved in Fe-S cluster assembly fused permease/ATPase subunit
VRVDEAGVRGSEGKQQVAIVRAMVLDTAMKREVLEGALWRLVDVRSCLSTVHRLRTIQDADVCVCVFRGWV